MNNLSPERYIGLISGTSMDGIDAALVRFENKQPLLEASFSLKYPDAVQQRLEAMILHPEAIALDELGQVDALVAECFAQAALELLDQQNLSAQDISALGSHGQNIRHRTDLEVPFTLQIGDPNRLAALTGINTVADFRRKDIALGGQGAPLVPAFHQAVFASNTHDRIVVNIGGISNLSLLKKDGEVRGHDCGPGNTLMDQWAQQHIHMPFDHSGGWARMGQVEPTLLLQLMTDDYFKLTPPKSTGREYFNLSWLNESLSSFSELDPMDTQTTLCELSAQCIALGINASIQNDKLDLEKVYVCGGGAHNKFLLERLDSMIPVELGSTGSLGIDADWVEAMAFAWFARQTLLQQTGNVPAVTGASRRAILGGIYYA